MPENLHNLALEKAIRKRDEFLTKHPELQEFQDSLTKELDKQPDETARMSVIMHHMRWNLHRIERINKEIKNVSSNW